MSEPSTTILLSGCVQRLQAGDEAARRELFEHASQRLQQLTRKMLRDFPRLQRWVETDDVFQSAMLKMHQSLQTQRPASAQEFFQWSARAIRETLIDFSRHYFGPEGFARRYATPAPNPADSDTRACDGDPAADTGDPAALARWTEVHEQIDSLPPQELSMFDLLWYHELTQQEAADLLGVDRRTVIRWWQSAKRMLLERVQGQLPGM